jgi:hypothetical protein
MLFYEHDMHGVMESHRQQSAAAVQQIESNRLLNTPTADVIEELFGRYRLIVPTLHRNALNVPEAASSCVLTVPWGNFSRLNENA